MLKKEGKKLLRNSKKGQVTLFIIIAILIVISVILFLIFKDNRISSNVPKEFELVYNYYSSCYDDATKHAVLIMGQQAGYIEPPEFTSGSSYMPFSSQLDFIGAPVPYWYYISGNGVVKEQVPTISEMERQLADFIEERMKQCDFTHFDDEGYIITIEEPRVDVEINDNNIDLDVKQKLNIKRGDNSYSANKHKFRIDSNLGSFYETAKKIYEYEVEENFLEDYSVDVLRLYAPVDGTKISCSPLLWSVNQVRSDVIAALEANIPQIKVKGNYYQLNDKTDEYFVKDIGENVNYNVNFLYQSYWPMLMDVSPRDGNLMQAKPIGTQEGLESLGFCYVTYHFVYDLAYPVMVQIYSNEEVFQFPVVVFVNKNQPRNPINGTAGPSDVSSLCEHKLTDIKVYTYDLNLNPIDADVYFKCFDTECYIGRTQRTSGDSYLSEKFPQCVNGFIIAKSLGYESAKLQISSLKENNYIMTLKRKYELDIDVRLNGEGKFKGRAVITFSKEDGESQSVVYPEQRLVQLSEGQYEVSAYVYTDSSLTMGGGSSEECIDVPKSGIGGILGFTEEKCFNFNVPNQEVGSAIIGGGKSNYYVSQTELQKSRSLSIMVDYFGSPQNLDKLQENYNKLEFSRVDLEFR